MLKEVSCFRAVLSIANLTASLAPSDPCVMCNNLKIETQHSNTSTDFEISNACKGIFTSLRCYPLQVEVIATVTY